jgi:hypothetical protein
MVETLTQKVEQTNTQTSNNNASNWKYAIGALASGAIAAGIYYAYQAYELSKSLEGITHIPTF